MRKNVPGHIQCMAVMNVRICSVITRFEERDTLIDKHLFKVPDLQRALD